MRWLPFFMVLGLATFLEAGDLLNVAALGRLGVRPSPLMWLLVYAVCSVRSKSAIWASFWVGLGLDLAGGALGAHWICATLFGLMAQRVCEAMPARRLAAQAALLFAVSIVVLMPALWLQAIKGGAISGQAHWYVFLKSVYTAAIGPFVLHFLRRFDRLTGMTAPSRSVWAKV